MKRDSITYPRWWPLLLFFHRGTHFFNNVFYLYASPCDQTSWVLDIVMIYFVHDNAVYCIVPGRGACVEKILSLTLPVFISETCRGKILDDRLFITAITICLTGFRSHFQSHSIHTKTSYWSIISVR